MVPSVSRQYPPVQFRDVTTLIQNSLRGTVNHQKYRPWLNGETTRPALDVNLPAPAHVSRPAQLIAISTACKHRRSPSLQKHNRMKNTPRTLPPPPLTPPHLHPQDKEEKRHLNPTMRALVLLAGLLALPASSQNANDERYFPSAWVTGGPGWDEAIGKARDFVGQLTLAEKVNLTTGTGWEADRCVGVTGSVPRLSFRGFCLQDGPLGVRFGTKTALLPTPFFSIQTEYSQNH